MVHTVLLLPNLHLASCAAMGIQPQLNTLRTCPTDLPKVIATLHYVIIPLQAARGGAPWLQTPAYNPMSFFVLRRPVSTPHGCPHGAIDVYGTVFYQEGMLMRGLQWKLGW